MCLHVILVLQRRRFVRSCVHHPRWDASKGPFHRRNRGTSLSKGRRRSFTQTCAGRANNPFRVARVAVQTLLLDGEKEVGSHAAWAKTPRSLHKRWHMHTNGAAGSVKDKQNESLESPSQSSRVFEQQLSNFLIWSRRVITAGADNAVTIVTCCLRSLLLVSLAVAGTSCRVS